MERENSRMHIKHKKDLNQVRCEVRNIVEKLDTMMARQQETKDRGKFLMKLHPSRLISDRK